jgi:hypothetical protein
VVGRGWVTEGRLGWLGVAWVAGGGPAGGCGQVVPGSGGRARRGRLGGRGVARVGGRGLGGWARSDREGAAKWCRVRASREARALGGRGVARVVGCGLGGAARSGGRARPSGAAAKRCRGQGIARGGGGWVAEGRPGWAGVAWALGGQAGRLRLGWCGAVRRSEAAWAAGAAKWCCGQAVPGSGNRARRGRLGGRGAARALDGWARPSDAGVRQSSAAGRPCGAGVRRAGGRRCRAGGWLPGAAGVRGCDGRGPLARQCDATGGATPGAGGGRVKGTYVVTRRALVVGMSAPIGL